MGARGMIMPSLHEIASEIENALTSLDDYEGPEEERAAVEAAVVPYLDFLATQEAEKVDAIAYVDRKAHNEIEFLKEEEARIRAKRQSLERRRASFCDFLRQTMIGHGLKKVAGKSSTLSLRSTEAVEVTGNPQDLPEAYRTMTVTYTAKKNDIKTALKAGEIIPGCAIVTGQMVHIR
jgi:hypothetical protein